MTAPRGPLTTALLALLCLVGAGRLAAGLTVPAKAVLAQWLLERAFARGRADGRPVRPWPWADVAPVARLRVPALSVERIVLGGGSGQALAFGPGLLAGGAPLGGRGVAVVAAHRDTHFRFLRRLGAGELIEVQPLAGPALRFRVTGGEVVRWDGFVPGGGATSELALVTCYPFDAVRHGPLRYVLHAVAVPVSAAAAPARG